MDAANALHLHCSTGLASILALDVFLHQEFGHTLTQRVAVLHWDYKHLVLLVVGSGATLIPHCGAGGLPHQGGLHQGLLPHLGPVVQLARHQVEQCL